MKSLKVLIVDDLMLVRNGLKQLFTEEYRGVVFGEAGTAEQAFGKLAKHAWDLVVLDTGIPDKDGFHVLQELLSRWPGTRVLMLSTRTDPQSSARAHQLGASGYLCKGASRSELVTGVKQVLAGKGHFATVLPGALPAPIAAEPKLSAREYKVLLASAEGKGTSAIAAELGLSVKTISTYKRRILDKLHLKSTADLVRYVIDHRLS